MIVVCLIKYKLINLYLGDKLLLKKQYKNDKNLLIVHEMFFRKEYLNILNHIMINKEIYEKYGIVLDVFIKLLDWKLMRY